ncbi:MAG: hypothetical protein GEV08_06220 [Acidimicrobiia bacterium]|nr:hypothetical protein [Acidimicrobiia bacterium]
MLDIVRSYLEEGKGLVQLATVLLAGVMVLAAWARTRSAMATVAAMVLGALVIGYTLNAEWLGQRVGADIVERENGMPALVGSAVPTVQLGPAMELWLRTAALVLLFAAGAGCVVVLVKVWALDMRSPARACKRGLIRAGWSSVARSAGLAVTRDKRRVPTGTALALLSGPMDKPRKRPAQSARSEQVERLPTLRHGRATASKAAVEYVVKPPRGGSLDDIAARTDHLAAGLGVHQVNVHRVNPSEGRLVVTLDDVLARSRRYPGPGSGVGVTSTGDPLRMPLLGGHWLLAGVTGSGKSAWLAALLAELVTSGVPRRMLGIDPKVVELAPWADCFDRLVVDPEEAGQALAAVHAEVTGRYQLLAEQGRRKLEVPTVEMPLIVVVVDELGELARQAPGEAKTAPQERLRVLSSLAAVGRGAGCVLICATQRPSAQLIGADLRANLTRRVCCRTSDEYGAEATLGPVASVLRPWDIDPATPGVAWVTSEAWPHPQLARSWWLDEDEVAAIADVYPARPPVDPEVGT